VRVAHQNAPSSTVTAAEKVNSQIALTDNAKAVNTIQHGTSPGEIAENFGIEIGLTTKYLVALEQTIQF
jgi:hypothetical protein